MNSTEFIRLLAVQCCYKSTIFCYNDKTVDAILPSPHDLLHGRNVALVISGCVINQVFLLNLKFDICPALKSLQDREISDKDCD